MFQVNIAESVILIYPAGDDFQIGKVFLCLVYLLLIVPNTLFLILSAALQPFFLKTLCVLWDTLQIFCFIVS